MTRSLAVAVMTLAAAFPAAAPGQLNLRMDPTTPLRLVGPSESFTLQMVLSNETSSADPFVGATTLGVSHSVGGAAYDVDVADGLLTQLGNTTLAPGQSILLDYLQFTPLSPPKQVGDAIEVSRFEIVYFYSGQISRVTLTGARALVAPEPSSSALFIFGCAALGIRRR